MKRTRFSNLALACQLFAATVGLSLAAPAQDSQPTADQQKMNPADRDLTKKIRMALHDDQSLSTYAHNIKIISQDGKVTLKGPVRSDEEKSAVDSEVRATSS